MSLIEGMQQTLSLFKNLEARASRAALAAVEELTAKIFEKSQYYCPVSPAEGPRSRIYYGPGAYEEVPQGYLKESGTHYAYQDKDGSAVGVIIYNAPYAIYVHEVPASHAAPTRWKFVTQAVLDLAKDASDIIAGKFRTEVTAYGFGGPSDVVPYTGQGGV